MSIWLTLGNYSAITAVEVRKKAIDLKIRLDRGLPFQE